MAKQKIEQLAIGERKNGIWRRSKDVYVVAVPINGKKHQRSFGSDYEAAHLYAQRIAQERQLQKLKGDNPLLDQIVSVKSGINIGDVLANYVRVKKPFLKPGTIEFYQYLMNRLTPLHALEAETISNSEITHFIGSLKTEGLSNKIIKEIVVSASPHIIWLLNRN